MIDLKTQQMSVEEYMKVNNISDEDADKKSLEILQALGASDIIAKIDRISKINMEAVTEELVQQTADGIDERSTFERKYGQRETRKFFEVITDGK